MYDVVLINSSAIPTTKVRGLGPHLLAEELRKHGYSVIVLDYIEHWNIYEFGRVVDAVIGPNTKLVGFSLTWTIIGSGAEKVVKHVYSNNFTNDVYLGDYITNGRLSWMTDRIKSRNSNVKIIVGGSKAPELEQRLGDLVDNVFCGYSETQFVDYLKAPETFPRVINHDTKAHATHTCFDFAKSRAIFTPNTFLSPQEIMPIECSRGCRFKCKFCSFPLIGMKDVAGYTKTKQTFRDTLVYNYETFGIQKYSIQDDTFNDSIEKVRMFAEVVDSLPFNIYFWCYLRADLVVKYPEQIELLHQMGLVQTWFGIETFNRASGRAVGKGGDPDKIKEMLYKAKEVWKGDVLIEQGYIVGLPYESVESIKHHAKWLLSDESPVDQTTFVPLHIVPKELQDKYIISYTSEFDREYQKHGYSFPDGNNPDHQKAMNWEKIDGSDITSFNQAKALCVDLGKYTYHKKPLYPLKPSIFDTARDYKEFADFDKVRNMSPTDYKTMLGTLPTHGDTEQFIERLRESYIEPLIESITK